MKKAVATALVLIAGAAVVLWYGNTLNSWVLGGLIGGFAALLLSIPISLTLFTYLSHRHEERLQAEKEAEEAERHEQMERAYPQPVYVYREIPVTGRTVSIEEEEFDPESNTYIAANRNGTTSWLDERGRSLQGPPSPRQLPAPRKTQYPALGAPRTQPSTAATRKLTRELERTRQPAVTRRLGYPGFPGYQSEESRSRYQSLQSQALRMAREEAARQYDEEDGIVVDSSLSPISPDQEDVTTGKIASRRTRFFTDPETEVPDMQPFTGDLHKPLQRRAPYMYEDDRQRHGFLQQGVPPITRRSSRRLSTPLDDE